MTTTNTQKGFTLLEFVLYIGLLAIIVTAAVMFTLQFVIAQSKAQVYAQAARNAEFAMERIRIEVEEADAVNAGTTVYVSNPGTLSLANAVSGNNPTVFTVTNGQLTVQQGAGAAIALTEPGVNVTEFTITNLAPNVRSQYLRIHMKVQAQTTGGYNDIEASADLDTTMHIRRNDGFTMLWPTLL